jgi:arylsulfatase
MGRAIACVSILLLAIPAVAQPAGASKPNILFILMDNTGWGDFGAYGGGLLRGAPTPNIDRLASEGTRLLNFNTEPQCTPSRSALMTGRFAIRSGTQTVPVGTRRYGLVPWERTIASALSDVGYATGLFGKWHLGQTAGRLPTDKGFDEWFGIPNSAGESVWSSQEWESRNSNIGDINLAEDEQQWVMEGVKGAPATKLYRFDLESRRAIDAEITKRAIAFMKKSHRNGKPFFAYVPYTAMHFPTIPHPDFAGKSGHGDYADMLVQTDHYIGLLQAALSDLGIAKDTIVILTADNGVEDPGNGAGQYTGWSGPWAGTYFTAMEGGLRTPFIIRWADKVPAGAVNNQIVHLVDMFPTLAGFAGAKIPTDRPIDGIDMSTFFLGRKDTSGRDGFPIFVGDDLRAVKWHDWKQHYAWAPSKYSPVERYSTAAKLIDLIRDPREERQALEPFNGWTQFPMARLREKFLGSVKAFPNIPPGAGDDFVPTPVDKQ